MTPVERKDAFLLAIKQKGKSSPSAKYWDQLCKLLQKHERSPETDRLKNPLILGGSIASDAHKHERLGEQLDWTIRHECFDEAMELLEKLPEDAWNTCPLNEWEEEHPWVRGEW